MTFLQPRVRILTQVTLRGVDLKTIASNLVQFIIEVPSISFNLSHDRYFSLSTINSP